MYISVFKDEFKIKYGFIYNYWITNVTLTSNDNWRISNESDWTDLFLTIDPNTNIASDYLDLNSNQEVHSTYSYIAGEYLKSSGDDYWMDTNNSTNYYNFNVKGGGDRYGAQSYDEEDVSIFDGFFGDEKNTISFLCDWENTSIDEPDAVLSVYFSNDSYCYVYWGQYKYEIGNYIRLCRNLQGGESSLQDGTNVGQYIGNDGKKYDCIKIGNRVWINENLCETKLRNGDTISTYSSDEEWANICRNQIPAYCYLDNDINNAGNFGNSSIKRLTFKGNLISKKNN